MKRFILTLTALAGLALFAAPADANGRAVAFRGGVRNGGFGAARFNLNLNVGGFHRGIAFRNNFAFRHNVFAFRAPFYGYGGAAAFVQPFYGASAFYAPQAFYSAPVAFSGGCGSAYYGGGTAGFSQPPVNVTQNLSSGSSGEVAALSAKIDALTQEFRAALRQPQRQP